MRSFTGWLGSHPQVATLIDKTLLALGVGLTVLGSAAIVAGVAAMVGAGGYIALTAIGLSALGLTFHSFPGVLTDADKALQKFVWGIVHPFAKGSWLDQGPGGTPPHPSGSGSWNPAEAAIKEGWHAIAEWVGKGAPVVVTNPGDIGRASAAVALRNLHQGLTAPNSGPTGFNPSASPSGSAASGALTPPLAQKGHSHMSETNPSTILTDSTGRAIEFQSLKPSEQFRLVKVLGNASKNEVYMAMAMSAASVRGFDSLPVPWSTSEQELERIFDRLGDAGLEAIQKHVESLKKPDETADDAVIDSAKN